MQTNPSAARSSTETILHLAIALGCGVRCWEAIVHNPLDHLFSDALRHWEHAAYPLVPAPMALFDPPLYQIWLSLVQKWSLGLRPLVGIYAAALSVVTPWLWYRFLREAVPSRPLALVGWAALSLLPTWIGIFSYFMTETLLLPLLGAGLWLTLRAKRKNTLAAFLLMVAVWLLAGLTRAVAFPLGAFAILWVWLEQSQKPRKAIWSLVLAAAALVPLGYRNYQFISLWHPYGNPYFIRIYAESGKREIVFRLFRRGAQWTYSFISPATNKRPLEPLSDWTSTRSGRVVAEIDLLRGETDWRKALEVARAAGLRRWQLRFENLVNVMVGDSWPDNNRGYLSGRLSIAFRWPWLPLLACVLFHAVRNRRQTLQQPLLPLLIVVWFLQQAVSLAAVNEGRYRKPLEGLLIAQVLVIAARARPRGADQERTVASSSAAAASVG